MLIRQADNQVEYDGFVMQPSKAQFLQSWGWGNFQTANGNEVKRFLLEDEGGIIASASVISKPLIAGKRYLYCPRGLVFADGLSEEKRQEASIFLLKSIADSNARQKPVFIRLEPREAPTYGNFDVRQTIDIQPKKTIMLDLSKSEDELLAEMHQKTRYNIRLAEKKGVKVSEYGVDQLNIFWELMKETTERDGFRPHSAEYYRRMMEILGSKKDKGGLNFKLLVAQFEGRPLAAMLAAFYGDTATYVHGASSDSNRQVMAPFALQWEAIKLAQKEGCRHYDFYGIDEEKWPGVTRFKRGFGGFEDCWSGTHDVVFSQAWYNGYGILRKIRRKIRIF